MEYAVRLVFLICLLCGASPAVAQIALPLPDPQPANPPVFRSGADLVALNVAVTDRDQRYVQGLTAEDFAVFEDGVRQDVSFFAASEVPLDLILLVDTSASMSNKMQTLHAAARGFLDTLRPGDRGAVVAFADSVKVVEPLTGDRARLAAAVASTRPRGATALHNALYISLKEFGRSAKQAGEVRRQAIAVFSDGDDTCSLVSFDEVLEQAKRSGVSIYTIALRSGSAAQEARRTTGGQFSQALYSMKTLAHETGAQSFFPKAIEELTAVYARIAEELENQYAIGYTPGNHRADGRFRRVVVQVVDRPELRPRARTGYFADNATPTAMTAPVNTAERRPRD
jgi:Ca-activated chloride channel family protein